MKPTALTRLPAGHLYMLVDAIGIRGTLAATSSKYALQLIGSKSWVFSLPALDLMDMKKSKYVNSLINDHAPPILEVAVAGNLNFVLMLDSKGNHGHVVRLFVIDTSKGPSPVPSPSGEWSRRLFYTDLSKVMTAEYRLDGLLDKWELVPDGRKRMELYVEARRAGVDKAEAEQVVDLTMDTGLSVGEAVAKFKAEKVMARISHGPTLRAEDLLGFKINSNGGGV